MPFVNYNGTQVITLGHVEDATNALRYLVNAYEGEPLFVIRGRDMFAPIALHAYASVAASQAGMYEQVIMHRARFIEWQERSRDLLKFPDPYPGWGKITD